LHLYSKYAKIELADHLAIIFVQIGQTNS
jgi:hypothetical protein